MKAAVAEGGEQDVPCEAAEALCVARRHAEAQSGLVESTLLSAHGASAAVLGALPPPPPCCANDGPDEAVALIRWLSLHGAADNRRAAARLLALGRVTLNGQPCAAPSAPVRLCDRVAVGGEQVAALHGGAHYHVLLHKPAGCLTSRGGDGRRGLAESSRRATVYDFLGAGARQRHCCAVGRLDFDTSGALLFTTDGALAAALLHPRRRVPKLYLATLRPPPRAGPGPAAAAAPLPASAMQALAAGVLLPPSQGKPALLAVGDAFNVDVPCEGGQGAAVVLRVTGGAYHQVKRMLAAVGSPVAALRRLQFAGLCLGDLAPGASRELSPAEAGGLYAVAAAGEGAEAADGGADAEALPACS